MRNTSCATLELEHIANASLRLEYIAIAVVNDMTLNMAMFGIEVNCRHFPKTRPNIFIGMKTIKLILLQKYI